MENKNLFPAIAGMDLEGRPEFNVVLAYDEIAGGMRAKECFDDLTRLHSELFNFNCRLWNFELMRKPELFEAAAQDAAKADMIVVATRQGETISGEPQRWIQSWARSRGAGREAILVLLSDKVAGAGFRSSLRKMAERRGVAFLWKKVSWPATASQLAARAATPIRHEPRPQLASVAMADAGQPRWGLNE
jgi:hypothetical protein